MSSSKRFSVSSARSAESPFVPTATALDAIEQADSDQWKNLWQTVLARDLIDSRIVSVDADTSVEEACDILLSEDILFLAVKSGESDLSTSRIIGLLDFSDVNAFLTLAATRHTYLPEDLQENPRVQQIVSAAMAGRVPTHLVSNLSEKNPLEHLPHDASLLSLLSIFSRGPHRVLIQSPASAQDYLGSVSDRRLLSWFHSYAQTTPSFSELLSKPLQRFSIPSLNIYSSVVASTANSTVLDAMKLMSEEGVSSIAVVDETHGNLLSAISVTDIGKIVVPSSSNLILSTALHRFVSQIKEPDGSTDGVDKYPVYSVLPSSALSYTIEKLLATNAHRLFVTKEPVASPSFAPGSSGNLSGIVSIVDILSLFARIVNLPDVDPTRMQRHRRASSSSSLSSKSGDFARSRSSSRTSVRQSPRIPAHASPAENRNPLPSLDPSIQWAERVPK